MTRKLEGDPPDAHRVDHEEAEDLAMLLYRLIPVERAAAVGKQDSICTGDVRPQLGPARIQGVQSRPATDLERQKADLVQQGSGMGVVELHDPTGARLGSLEHGLGGGEDPQGGQHEDSGNGLHWNEGRKRILASCVRVLKKTVFTVPFRVIMTR